MLDIIETILKLIFFIITLVWIHKIMIRRSDEQVVINPVIIFISCLLISLPSSEKYLFGIHVQTLRIILYILYVIVVSVGILILKRKNKIFY